MATKIGLCAQASEEKKTQDEPEEEEDEAIKQARRKRAEKIVAGWRLHGKERHKAQQFDEGTVALLLLLRLFGSVCFYMSFFACFYKNFFSLWFLCAL